MRARANADHRQPALFRAHRHLDNHRANAARRNHDHRVVCAKLEALQNLFGIAFVFFEMQRRAQAVRADDVGVIRQREFDHRDEADKAALARRHLFAHHSRMAIAEEKDQSLVGDAVRADLGGLFDVVELRVFEFL